MKNSGPFSSTSTFLLVRVRVGSVMVHRRSAGSGRGPKKWGGGKQYIEMDSTASKIFLFGGRRGVGVAESSWATPSREVNVDVRTAELGTGTLT